MQLVVVHANACLGMYVYVTEGELCRTGLVYEADFTCRHACVHTYKRTHSHTCAYTTYTHTHTHTHTRTHN
jgi:hypothetical protein